MHQRYIAIQLKPIFDIWPQSNEHIVADDIIKMA